MNLKTRPVDPGQFQSGSADREGCEHVLFLHVSMETDVPTPGPGSQQQSLPVRLHEAQGHRAVVGPDPERRVQGLSEGGGEGVKVDHDVLRDTVEGQRACRPVQVDPDSMGERSG